MGFGDEGFGFGGQLKSPPPLTTWGAGRFVRELSRSFPLSHHVWGIGGDNVGLIHSTKAPKMKRNFDTSTATDESTATYWGASPIKKRPHP